MLWRWSPLAAVGVLALSHALVLFPTFRPTIQWLGPVITRFATEKREVWITIDDGPTDDTAAVLALFDTMGVKATFFVKGVLARQHPDRVAEILARGHSVANHSMTHPAGSFWCALPRRVAEEIDGCNDAIAGVTGARPRWFRAPVGIKNPAVHPALDRRGMRLIGWSARGFDAVVGDTDKVVARVLRDLRPGAIILLHQGQPWSLGTLERVLSAICDAGYACVIPDDAALRTGSY